MKNNSKEKKSLREKYALKTIENPVILDSKLLKQQINTLSRLTAITNNEIGDLIIGAEQVLEIFEWLPKGEYVITVKIT